MSPEGVSRGCVSRGCSGVCVCVSSGCVSRKSVGPGRGVCPWGVCVSGSVHPPDPDVHLVGSRGTHIPFPILWELFTILQLRSRKCFDPEGRT